MQPDAPLPDWLLQPPQPYQKQPWWRRFKRATPTRHKRKNKSLIIGMLAVVLLAGVGSGLFAYRVHRHNTSFLVNPFTPKPSVTFYYDDGKTVLWRSDNPAVATDTPSETAPSFVDYLRHTMREKFGDAYYEQGDWEITTTLNAGLQATAEKLAADNIAIAKSKTGGQANVAAVLLQNVHNGQIKAYVGSTDYAAHQQTDPVDFTIRRIAPGSAIKPFDYAALIENTANTGAGTEVLDTQRPLAGWLCTNKERPGINRQANNGNCLWDYDLRYPGAMPLRYALGGNRNVPAVQAALTVGIDKTIDLIERAGVEGGYYCTDFNTFEPSRHAPCYGSAALGDGAYLSLLDEIRAFSTLANNGKKVPQTAIQSVKLNSKTKVAWQDPAGEQVLKPETAYIINDILADPNANYLPDKYKFHRYNGWHFAISDGITNNDYSAQIASWSTQYAAIAWMGNRALNTDAFRGAPQLYTTPIARGLMEAAHANQTAANWSQPSGIQTLPATVRTEKISHLNEVVPTPATDLYPSWYKEP